MISKYPGKSLTYPLGNNCTNRNGRAYSVSDVLLLGEQFQHQRQLEYLQEEQIKSLLGKIEFYDERKMREKETEVVVEREKKREEMLKQERQEQDEIERKKRELEELEYKAKEAERAEADEIK
ncbi:hypothetical protein ACFWDG_20990 [Peribacillus sp. NPDC060186]